MLGFRWRRDGWLVGSVVLAVLIVGSAVAYRSRSGRPVIAPRASPVPSATSGVPLPYGSVGVAEAIYACVQGCPPVLRVAAGREFGIPTDAPSVRDLTLSPDGRWLGYPFGSGYVLRDLVTSAEHRLGSRTVYGRLAAWAWSPDSSTLLMAELRDGQPVGYVAQVPAADASSPVTAWPGHDLLGVRNPLELLTIRTGSGSATQVMVDLATPTGTTVSSFTVDASSQLRQEERIAPDSVRFTRDGYEIVVVRPDDDEPAAVLRFGGAAATTNRFDLTVPGPGRWTVRGVGDRGRAFVRNGEGHTVVWYLAGDGTFTADIDLPGDLEVITPGTARR